MFLKFLGFFMLTFVVWIGIGMISDHITQYPFRYRVTVEVDTPDGVKSGSSVVEALYFRQMIFQQLVGPRFPTNFTGEATFVDLGGGRNVVLTVSGLPEYLAVRAFKFPWGITRADSKMRDAVAKAKQAGPKATPLGGAPYIHLPMMVTFRVLLIRSQLNWSILTHSQPPLVLDMRSRRSSSKPAMNPSVKRWDSACLGFKSSGATRNEDNLAWTEAIFHIPPDHS
jgi:hypothetical protein